MKPVTGIWVDGAEGNQLWEGIDEADLNGEGSESSKDWIQRVVVRHQWLLFCIAVWGLSINP